MRVIARTANGAKKRIFVGNLFHLQAALASKSSLLERNCKNTIEKQKEK